MANAIIAEQPKNGFTVFPEEIESFFSKQELIISLYPTDIITDQDQDLISFKVTSASQYYSYLSEETCFWDENDPRKKFETIVYHSRYKNAKSYFENALNYVNSPNSMENYLRQSMNSLSPGALSSKTMLAKTLLEYSDMTSSFISGFRLGMLVNNNITVQANADTLQGFFAAMIYRKVFDAYTQISGEKMVDYKNNIEKVTKNYSDLNQKYITSFLEQEKRIESITKQTNEHFVNIETEKSNFFDSAKVRLEELELLYGEKLKLSKPAEYWKDLEGKYRNKGTWWLVFSGALSLIIIVGLVLFLLFAPTMFSDDYHWIDNLKNSAIITVVASIAIYMLRLTVKMAISSYHLSRDAKERENLAYFYLALIEEGAVSDKERALILNSLFSRSDTGLLKGESAPTMPTNVSDIVELFKNN